MNLTIMRRRLGQTHGMLLQIWETIYRLTGAAALDRTLDNRRRQRDAHRLTVIAAKLDAAGLDDLATRCRTAARSA